MATSALRSPLLCAGAAKPLLVAHRAGGGEAPENTLQSLQYCIDLKVPLVQMDVMRTKDGQLILFHDMPVEKNLEKLTGVAGDIASLDYSALPDFKAEFEPSAMCPPGSQKVAVAQRRISLFRDACLALAKSSHTDLIIEFWQESEIVVQEVLAMLREFGLQSRVAAWGSPEVAAVQQWCRSACAEIPVIVTFKQSFLVWLYWNVGLLRCGYPVSRLLPFHSDSEPRIIFNVLYVAEVFPHAIFKLAKVDPERSPLRAGLIRFLLRLLKGFTDTPRLFRFLRERCKVPTVLFIANTARDVDACASYPGVVGVQTDFPKQFMNKLTMAE